MQLLKGKPVVEAMRTAMKTDTAMLRARGVVPTLAMIRLGDRPDDLSYERGARKKCEAAGIAPLVYALPIDISQERLMSLIKDLNADKAVHGILLFRPVPGNLDDAALCGALTPDKDADGITNASLRGVFTGTGIGYAPCTAQACIEILDYYGISIEGKRAVVIGRSLVVGRPLAMMLLQRNATVTICHTKTRDVPAAAREAEILVAAVGKEEMIDRNYFSPGQVVLDVGIHVKADGSLCGDVKASDAEPLVAALTPVPGGIGPITTEVLLRHVVDSALRQT